MLDNSIPWPSQITPVPILELFTDLNDLCNPFFIESHTSSHMSSASWKILLLRSAHIFHINCKVPAAHKMRRLDPIGYLDVFSKHSTKDCGGTQNQPRSFAILCQIRLVKGHIKKICSIVSTSFLHIEHLDGNKTYEGHLLCKTSTVLILPSHAIHPSTLAFIVAGLFQIRLYASKIMLSASPHKS